MLLNGDREELADLCHKQWSGWMKYLFEKGNFHENGSFTINKEFVERWVRQLNTDYKDLHESEKVSDRIEADKIIKLMTVTYHDVEKYYYDNDLEKVFEEEIDEIRMKATKKARMKD